MNSVDVKCPICGAMNESLNLEETDGWMECESCGNAVQIMKYVKTRRVPCFQIFLTLPYPLGNLKKFQTSFPPAFELNLIKGMCLTCPTAASTMSGAPWRSRARPEVFFGQHDKESRTDVRLSLFEDRKEKQFMS